MNELEKATNAAFTYFNHNPDDEVAQSNYKWYINEMYKSVPDFVPVDREAQVSRINPAYMWWHSDYTLLLVLQEHTVKYQAGTKAYTAEEWTEVISQMEGAVTSYLEAENQCRRNCEKPFDMGWFPEFVVSMSSKISMGISLIHRLGLFYHCHICRKKFILCFF